jgi:hypothetical protein
MFHPIQREWMLASAWTECKDRTISNCDVQQELYFSENLGQDWNVLARYVV